MTKSESPPSALRLDSTELIEVRLEENQIRNPNDEFRSRVERRDAKTQRTDHREVLIALAGFPQRLCVSAFTFLFGLRHSDFLRISDFGFRISLGFFLIVASSSIAQTTSDPRSPIPKPTPQVMAEKKIRQQYRDQYTLKDSASRDALAHTLRSAARDLKAESRGGDDVPLRFVMLREARELAIDAGDFHLAMRCVDDIARDFIVDAREMKLSALAAGVDKADLPPAELADAYIHAADEFMEAGDLDAARRVLVLVHTVERNSRTDPGIKQRTAECEKRLADARRQYRDILAAAQKLKKDPDNSTLNQTVGQYLCTYGNWQQGLPMLTKATSGALKTLATKDLANPPDTDAMMDLANAWWVGEESKPIKLTASRRRAVYWYGKALPMLAGEKKAETQKRIAEIEEQ